MPITLTAQEHEEVRQSLKRYCARELDQEIGDLQARLLTDYILKEVAPFAYNRAFATPKPSSAASSKTSPRPVSSPR